MLKFKLSKMKSVLEKPVKYFLEGDTKIQVNDLIGKELSLEFFGQIFCVNCGKLTKKSFNQGYCYQCFSTTAQCDSCVMSPENCHFHLGTCRDEVWANKNCMIDHFVYLANSSGIKVGITRHTQIPTRFIDQGAIAALPIFKTKNRYIAGLIEDGLRHFVPDRTNWKEMLSANIDEVDLYYHRDELYENSESVIEGMLEEFGEDAISYLEKENIINLEYPVQDFPQKLKMLSLEKQSMVNGKLLGIKGQYLILDSGVINIRKHSGYEVMLNIQN